LHNNTYHHITPHNTTVAVAAGNSGDALLLPHLLATETRLRADIAPSLTLLATPVSPPPPPLRATPNVDLEQFYPSGARKKPRTKVTKLPGEGAARHARERAEALVKDVEMVCEHIEWAVRRLQNPDAKPIANPAIFDAAHPGGAKLVANPHIGFSRRTEA
jgi:hypothetical protein